MSIHDKKYVNIENLKFFVHPNVLFLIFIIFGLLYDFGFFD